MFFILSTSKIWLAINCVLNPISTKKDIKINDIVTKPTPPICISKKIMNLPNRVKLSIGTVSTPVTHVVEVAVKKRSIILIG